MVNFRLPFTLPDNEERDPDTPDVQQEGGAHPGAPVRVLPGVPPGEPAGAGHEAAGHQDDGGDDGQAPEEEAGGRGA